MSFTQPWLEVDFGSAHGGLGTVGFRLYKVDGTDSVARTTSGVQDISGAGAYGVASVTIPDDAVGIEWDTGGGSPVFAVEDLEPYRDRDAILADTDAMDTRLPTDPADIPPPALLYRRRVRTIAAGADRLSRVVRQLPPQWRIHR